MPRKSDAVPVGTAPCLSCGAENHVYQDKRGFLYMRTCRGCGSADQRIGENVQTEIYHTLRTGEGTHIKRPKNVPETCPDWLKKAPVEPAPVPTPVPVVPIGTHLPPTPVKKGNGGILFLIFAALLGITGAGISILSATQPKGAS